ncbi:NAD nucleotidase [Pseudaeromonas paramecii]|uniref:NAD nucleotidase n=1 Tax=Pseudaeromonas paramecii TaxID=2138166 RepID=A0ABP8PXL1_9GAMM
MALLAAGGTLCLLAGCNDDDTQAAASQTPFTLNLLHINDHHSHLAPATSTLTLNGTATQVEMGGFPRVTALAKQLAATQAHPLLLHAGDAITGDLYYTLFQGEADAALMNSLCFDAMVAGNHEFDSGDAGFRTFIDYLHNGDCQTPVLAANVVPEAGVSPLYPESGSLLQPYVIKAYGDERVGIIGIATGLKTQSSSSPDASTQFLDEASTAQQYIDALQAEGVNKIVLLSHYGYGEDMAMAAKLTGVDVIIDGDSHSLLGEGFSELGLNPAGPYPTETQDADGNKVCLAQAWQYADVLGELNVTFDGQGVVQGCSGTPHLLLGDSFKQKDAEGNYVALTGDALTALTTWVNDHPLLAIVPPDPAAQTLLTDYAGQVDALKADVIGQANEDLCLSRIPGDSRSALCDSAATRAHGADISNLVAQAFLAMSKDAQIAIQNAGGVRTDVAAGDISIGTAYTLLPFANTLTNLDMTGAEIRQVLNQAVDYAFNPDGSTGSYPYAAGLRFDVDRSRAEGARLFNIETRVKGSGEWVALDDSARYQVVTNSFTAQGKDNYLTFGTVSADGRAVDTYLDYAQSFVDYVKAQGSLSKPAEEDYSTQHFYDADGVLQQ